MRTEPEINRSAVNVLMPKPFEVIDPDSMMGQAQLAGMEIHGFASAHLAASNRALWRRVAELERVVDDLTNVGTSECGSFIHHRFPVTHTEAVSILNRE